MLAKEKQTTKEIGDLGEAIGCKFLVERGFSIVGRNYFKKWGEIDIIASKAGKVHFVEVKTISHETTWSTNEVSRGTNGGYRPEENVHPKKLERLRRVIQSYIFEKKIEDGNWQFDVLAVVLDREAKTARCKLLTDIIL